MKHRSFVRVATVVATLGVSFVAAAQQPPTSPVTTPPGATAMPGSIADRVEQRLSHQHDALAITPSEESAWQQYAQAVHANARDLSKVFEQRHAALPTLSAMDNMQSMADAAAVHARNMQRLVAAFRPLYTAMPPQQQKLADTVFRTPGTRPK